MKYIFTLLALFLLQHLSAQNALVTHQFIQQKVAAGYFRQRPATTIPIDNKCITVAEAKAWLFLDETKLPTNGRMPWWSELVPASVAFFNVKRLHNKAVKAYAVI
ncbi:hypothetical protein [Chitinophaga sp. RAB17]|uniref:hypothetical protein n=1 Tax=Chitinophaga sp. RAB17 TaxID=3233049 RepID=UPI003F8FB076